MTKSSWIWSGLARNYQKKIKKDLGIYEVTKILHAPKNAKRRVKRAAGYESEGMKIFRFIQRLFK